MIGMEVAQADKIEVAETRTGFTETNKCAAAQSSLCGGLLIMFQPVAIDISARITP